MRPGRWSTRTPLSVREGSTSTNMASFREPTRGLSWVAATVGPSGAPRIAGALDRAGTAGAESPRGNVPSTAMGRSHYLPRDVSRHRRHQSQPRRRRRQGSARPYDRNVSSGGTEVDPTVMSNEDYEFVGSNGYVSGPPYRQERGCQLPVPLRHLHPTAVSSPLKTLAAWAAGAGDQAGRRGVLEIRRESGRPRPYDVERATRQGWPFRCYLEPTSYFLRLRINAYP